MQQSHPVTHVAWSCDGKKFAAVGLDKSTRVWNPEKSVCLRSNMSIIAEGLYRWSSEPRRCTRVPTLTMWTTSLGTQLIPSCSALPVKKIDGSYSGMRDVRYLEDFASYHSQEILRKSERAISLTEGVSPANQLRA